MKASTSRARRLAQGSVVTAGTAAALISVASPAWADHGTARWSPSVQNDGAQVGMNITYGADAIDWASGGFVAQALWVCTANTTQGTQNWVEVGWTKGWEKSNIQVYYWADGHDGGYWEQPLGSAVANPAVAHTFQINESGQNQWAVSIDGTVRDYSTSNPLDSRCMQTGAEATHGASTLNPTGSAGLKYKTGSTWHDGWYASLVETGSAWADWVTPGYHLVDGV